MLLTADSEVRNRANFNAAANTYNEWQTVTHAFAFGSGNQVVAHKETPQILLVQIGPVPIYGKFHVNLEIASCAEPTPASGESRTEACKARPFGQVKRLLAGQYSSGTIIPLTGAWPPPRTIGGWTSGGAGDGAYNDDAWLLDNSTGHARDRNLSAPNFFLPFSVNTPMGVRMFQDNDKAMDVRTELRFGSTFTPCRHDGTPGVCEMRFPPFLTVKADVSGQIQAGGTVVHSFREQEEVRMRHIPDAEFPRTVPDAVTALTCR